LNNLHNQAIETAQRLQKSVAEAEQNVKNVQREKAEIEAKAEKQIRIYTEQLANLKVANAEAIVQAKSELESKAGSYADTITKMQADAASALALQKEKFETETAKEIGKIKAQTSDEITKLKMLLEEKTKEYKVFREEVISRAESEKQSLQQAQQQLQEYTQQLMPLKEQFKAESAARQNAESQLKELKQALVKAQEQIGVLTKQLIASEKEAADKFYRQKQNLR